MQNSWSSGWLASSMHLPDVESLPQLKMAHPRTFLPWYKEDLKCSSYKFLCVVHIFLPPIPGNIRTHVLAGWDQWISTCKVRIKRECINPWVLLSECNISCRTPAMKPPSPLQPCSSPMSRQQLTPKEGRPLTTSRNSFDSTKTTNTLNLFSKEEQQHY